MPASDKPRRARRRTTGTTEPDASIYEALAAKLVTVGGSEQAIPLKQALQQQILKSALGGKLKDIRRVLKWIREREAARRRKATVAKSMPLRMEQPYTDINDALFLLGIAKPADAADGPHRPAQIQLELWVVQQALSRRTGPKLEEAAVVEITRCTRDAPLIRWPRGTKQ